MILRGVRVIDPLAGLDADGHDIWLESGVIRAIERHIDSTSVPVVDFTPVPGAQSVVMCPGFIDLHAHLRQPGDATVETIATGAQAAAAGGFTHVVAMANTDPPIDSPERVAAAVDIARGAAVHVMHVAAVSRGLQGEDLVDIRGCIEAGAVALSDDGRNTSGPEVLTEALRQADEFARPVLVHPEDEKAIARVNYQGCAVTRCPDRPPETEVDAVKTAVKALVRAELWTPSPAARLGVRVPGSPAPRAGGGPCDHSRGDAPSPGPLGGELAAQPGIAAQGQPSAAQLVRSQRRAHRAA